MPRERRDAMKKPGKLHGLKSPFSPLTGLSSQSSPNRDEHSTRRAPPLRLFPPRTVACVDGITRSGAAKSTSIESCEAPIRATTTRWCCRVES